MDIKIEKASPKDAEKILEYLKIIGGDEIVGNASFRGLTREHMKHRDELAVSVKKSAVY